MSNNYEDIIKNKVNKYMEQIEVPKNIGGIIMEDFEKMKKEEADVQNCDHKEAGSEKKSVKNKKALKISIVAVSTVALIGTGVFIGSRFLGNSTTTINNNGAQNSNMATNNQVFDKKITIRKNQIENFGKLNQFLRNAHNGTEDEIEIETYLEPEWELAASTNEASKLYVKYDGTKYNVKYDIAEGMCYAKQTVEGEFSDVLIRKTTSQSSEYIEMELTFYRTNNNKLEILPVFFFKLSDVGIDPAEGSVKDLLAQDYKTYKKMNDEISNEVYDGLYNLEKDLRDKFGADVYKQKLQQLSIKDESGVINLIKDKEENVQNVKQDLVTDAFTYTKTIKDIHDEVFSYKIPKININSDDVNEINKEINDKIISQAKKCVSFLEKNESVGLYKVNYLYYINNDILSIVINSNHDNSIVAYYVYNIDIKSGKRVKNEELIKMNNMTKEQFTNKLQSATGNKFIEKYGEINDYLKTQNFEGSKEMYQSQYNNTISTSNCNADNQMIFLDANGKINVVAKIYSLAGADAYYHIVNLNDIKNIQTSEIKSETTSTDNNAAYTKTDLNVNGKYEHKEEYTGVYHCAQIQVSNQNDTSITFSMNATHGKDADHVNTGEVSGIAKKIDINKYVFEETIEGETYKITFTFDAHRMFQFVYVEESFDVSPYAGMNVHFSGDYEKIQ